MGHLMGQRDRQVWSSSHSHVLQAPLFDHPNMYQNSVMNHHHYYHHNHHSGQFNWPVATPFRETLPLNYNSRLQQRINWERRILEKRMQAFFLISPGSTSSGTGVFLPATAFRPPPKKPVCSPRIFPARVVPAINHNVQNNDTHISTRPETQGNDLKKNKKKNKNKSENVETPKTIEVEIPIEKLLPEEWIY